jgi:hypothetical protein
MKNLTSPTSTGLVTGLAAGFLGCLVGCQGPQTGDEAEIPPAFETEASAVVTTVYEAEAATLSGALVAADKTGFTGTGYADYQNPSGDFVEWTANVATAGNYTLGFRYANASSGTRPLAITINGALAQPSLAFPNTGTVWTSWNTVTFSAALAEGPKRIRATATGSSGANIDHLFIAAGTSGGGSDAGTPPPTTPTAAALAALTRSCNQISSGKYATDDGAAASVPICKLNGAVFWKADMDIDCDGKQTSTCSRSTDPWYQSQTSFGGALDAAALPYVVIPLPSSKFDYTKQGISGGQSVAVIYNDKVVYGVFGDEGPSNIIGEASVAMAKALGIPSNPKSGGVDAGVTYIVFTGSSGVVSPLTSTSQATSVGQARAADLLKQN